MPVKEMYVGHIHILDKLGRKECKSDKMAYAFIGFQTQRPERAQDHCDVK